MGGFGLGHQLRLHRDKIRMSKTLERKHPPSRTTQRVSEEVPIPQQLWPLILLASIKVVSPRPAQGPPVSCGTMWSSDLGSSRGASIDFTWR